MIDTWGARSALLVAGICSAAAGLALASHLAKAGHLRIRFEIPARPVAMMRIVERP